LENPEYDPLTKESRKFKQNISLLKEMSQGALKAIGPQPLALQFWRKLCKLWQAVDFSLHVKNKKKIV